MLGSVAATEQERIQFVGLSAPYREAVEQAFTGVGVTKDPIQVLTAQLDATIVIVFCASLAAFAAIAEASATPGTLTIAIVPDLNIPAFRGALLAGASGVIWENTPTSHLVSVARAALHGDLLLPSPVMRSVLLEVSDAPEPTDPSSEIDPASLALLQALSDGQTIKEIAQTMAYSDRTIQRKITNMCLALGAQTPAEAVHLAHRRGILS